MNQPNEAHYFFSTAEDERGRFSGESQGLMRLGPSCAVGPGTYRIFGNQLRRTAGEPHVERESAEPTSGNKESGGVVIGL